MGSPGFIHLGNIGFILSTELGKSTYRLFLRRVKRPVVKSPGQDEIYLVTDDAGLRRSAICLYTCPHLPSQSDSSQFGTLS